MSNGKKSVVDGAKLTDEQLGRLYRKLREIEKRINEGVISFPETLDVLQNIIIEGKSAQHLSVINGMAKIKCIEYLIDTDAAPFIPVGWSVRKHMVDGLWIWNPNSVELFLSRRQKKDYEIGTDLLKVISSQEGKRILNANVLDYLLAHPELIPESWRGKSVFFWGTIYRILGGECYVRYLFWDGLKWSWDCYWLGARFDASNPAAFISF